MDNNNDISVTGGQVLVAPVIDNKSSTSIEPAHEKVTKKNS
jgi:hypothetical protein